MALAIVDCGCARFDYRIHLPLFYSVVPQNAVLRPPIEDQHQHTHTWYSMQGLVAFATSLDWEGVRNLNSEFSKDTCHHFGKAKDVLTQGSSVVAQEGRENWFHEYVSCRQIVKSSTHCLHTVHSSPNPSDYASLTLQIMLM